jgi:hypothetical protein
MILLLYRTNNADSLLKKKTPLNSMVEGCPGLSSQKFPRILPVSNTIYPTGPVVKALIIWFGGPNKLEKIALPNVETSRSGCEW